MSYLARLKAEFSEKRSPKELTKPTKAPSVSFVSTQGGRIREIRGANSRAANDVGADELRRLVEEVAKANPVYWTAADIAEAVTEGMRDPDAALSTFRALAEERQGRSTLADPAAEARRQRVLAILASNPMLRLAVVCDGEGDPVPIAIGIRERGTCEVHVPAARFDPFALLDLVERHGAEGLQ